MLLACLNKDYNLFPAQKLPKMFRFPIFVFQYLHNSYLKKTKI